MVVGWIQIGTAMNLRVIVWDLTKNEQVVSYYQKCDLANWTGDIALYGQTPGPRIVIMGWIWAFAMLAVGLWRFQKQKDRFILYI
jgi:hypothetical protein